MKRTETNEMRCITCDAYLADTLRKPLDMCRVLGHVIRSINGVRSIRCGWGLGDGHISGASCDFVPGHAGPCGVRPGGIQSTKRKGEAKP